MPKILNVPFHKITLPEVLEKVKVAVENQEKLQIITLNTEMVMAAQKDEEFLEVIKSAALVIPESSGLQIAWQHSQDQNRLPKSLSVLQNGLKTVTGWGLKEPLEIIPGADLALLLAGMGEEFGYKLFLLGGKNGATQGSAEHLKKLFPKLKVDFFEGGNFKDEKIILEKVNSYAPDILFLALDSPRQEKWLASHLRALETKVVMGVGGTFDFWSGSARRAPGFVRKLGLEWAFRLVSEPERIKRQMALPRFLWKLTKEKSRQS